MFQASDPGYGSALPAGVALHGIDTLTEAVHPLAGMRRYTLTFRTAR